MRRQGTADQVQIGRVGQEQGRAFFVARLQILRTRFDGGHVGVDARLGGFRFNHAHVVKIPGDRAGGAQLPLAEQHAHLRCRPVHVVGQALDHDWHAVRGKAFINDVVEVNGFASQACALFDGAIQRVFGHGGLAGLFHRQPQARIGSRVGSITGGNHDFFAQFAKQSALGICGQILVFCFPLRAHG